MMATGHLAIVGASAAGLSAAEAARRAGFTGPMTLIGAEPHLPYDRPPLSKQLLTGTWTADRLTLRRQEALNKLAANWRLGLAATGLDVAAHTVRLSDGSEVTYDGLVIATGVAPRRLPRGHELAGVHVLRSLDDAAALQADLASTRSVVVVGAGLIGCEVAASARSLGLEVTIVEPLSTPMVRQCGDMVGAMVADLHRAHGVDLRLGVGVGALAGSKGRVAAVELTDGSTLDASVVVVAIGSVPNVDWLAGSGLTIGDGVECDSFCGAAPDVAAAGDVASWIHPQHGRMRIEHRTNAGEQAIAAVASLLGADAQPFAPIPYFWTDQYDMRIQVHGLPRAGDEAEIIVGSRSRGKFAVAYRRGDRTTAVLTWNMPKEAIKLRTSLLAPAVSAPSR